MPKRKHGLLKPSRNSSHSPTVPEEEPVCIWVQCENEHCHKWRQISAEEAKGVEDSSWYCWLNRDPRFNTCSAVEQKAKKPKHMKFIYSLLPEGEVVIAKMPGYPPWPGLLTRDPTCGEYYDAPLDKENEITHYHVEFFGWPRSRAWLVPALVHPLRSLNEIERAPKFKKIQGRQLIELKKSYEFALKEADNSISKTTDERLETCHFKYNEKDDKPATSVAYTEQAPTEKVQESKVPERRKSTTPLNSPTIPITMNKPWLCDSGDVMDSDWKEKEFMESLELFLEQQGSTVPKEPMWRGKRISLFKFYNLVIQNGGFENVCHCKLWNRVYNELLDSDVVYEGTCSAARVFYQKYLMPFELHLRNSKRNGIQFVLEDVPHSRTLRPDRRAGRSRRRTVSSSITDEGEQTVPQTEDQSVKDNPADFQTCTSQSREADHVPSSNPDSPNQSTDKSSFDSDESDDESTTSTCDVAEKELQQLERLLLSLEPSLYPPTDGDGPTSMKSSRVQQEQKSLPRTQGVIPEEVDVLKTLDEIARIEGAIADLSSLVSKEVEQL